MPIPTDTFWNIKRLNVVFAVSAVLLTLVTMWSILQDHFKAWHVSQQQARVWDAALTSERLEAETTNAQREADLKRIESELATANAALDKKRDRVDSLKSQIQKLTGEQSTREFALNNKKATLGVMEGALQDAIAADDKPRIERLSREIEQPRKEVGEGTESLKNEIIAPLEHAKQELRDETKQRDALEGQKRKLLSDRESLQKKLHTLDPKTQGGLWGFIGGMSSEIRNAPLLDFVNPSEKPAQAVLTDIKTDMNFELKIPTVDRCTSCHVNINRKEFSAERILSFLEEQAAVSRGYNGLPLVSPGKPTNASATKDKPGAVAMPDFWQAWALKVAPDAVKRNAGRINTVVGTVGKTTAITFNGQPLTTFKYNPALNAGPVAPSTQPTTAPSIDGPTQNTILVTLLEALYRGAGESKSADGKVVVAIKATDPKTLDAPRDVAMRYVEELRKGVTATVDNEQARLIDDRYRYALSDVVNVMRKQKGFAPLDASPALLAHPHLEMYVDADSKHPMEGSENKIGVGCTSCHDGSGQETDFVLAAHVAREIMVDQRTGTPVPAALLPKEALPHEDERSNLGSMLAVVAPEDEIVPKNVDALHVHLDAPHDEGAAKHETHEGSGENRGVSETGKTAEPAHHGHGDAPKPVNYVDPVTGKQSKAVTQFSYWKAKYEPEAPRDFALVYHEWDWPMRTPKYLEANCARCHSSILDIKDEAPTLYNGRQLFAELGCVNCHQMDSIPTEDLPTNAKHLDPSLVMSNGRVKVGPSLTNITAKLSPQFINTWIWAPKAFRPTTKMPHFFMLENNSSDEEIRRTRQEARAITEYLVQSSDPLPVAHPIQPSMKGSAEAGKSIFNAIGCQACHANVNDPTGDKRAGANGKAITLGEKWIVTDLIKAGELKKQMAEHSAGKDPDDKTLRAEAEKLYDAMSYNERQTYIKERFEEEPGQTEIKRYADNSAKPIFVHVGPELSAVGTKLTAGRSPEQARAWLFDWLKEPRHYSAYTIMPRLRLNDQQAMDLVEYLMAQTRKKENPDDKWEPGLADVDPDKQIELAALFLRSQFSAKTAIERSKDDKFITDLAVDAMKRSGGKSPEDDKVLLDEARKRVEGMPTDQKRMLWLGKKLIANYGCMSCHAINGTEKITSPCANLTNWGVKTVDKLDYGYVDPHKLDALPAQKPIMLVNGLSAEASKLAHDKFNFNETKIAQPVNAGWPVVEHLRQAWLTQKLKNTRVYDRGRALLEPDLTKSDDVVLKGGKPYDKLKMPTFYLSDEQVDQLVTFVISNRDEKGRPWLVSDKLAQKANTDVSRQISRGRELTTKFNCVSCHWIESNQPQIQQYFKAEDIGTRAPPALRGEGNKVQFGWLFNFFKNVQDLRPLLYQHNGIRMPSFPATDEEWAAIITYFNHVSNKEAKDLKERLDLVDKYVVAEKAKAGALPPPEKPWPGDDWFRKPEFEVTTAKLTKWALDTRNMQPIELDPSKSTPEDLGKKYRQAVYKARFTIDLYTSPFPFVENGQREVSDERFKLGGEFMQQMQCLSCHYLGDPNAPGAVKEPKAPNLSLTHARLQRRWVRHWVQEPPVIQPGTSMPAFFSGLAVFKVHGQTWSETAGRPKNEIDFYNGRYGKTADEQADLVLDYLYAAGQRGITEVNVPGNTLPHPEAPAAETPKTTPGPAGATSQPASGGDVPAKSPPTTAPVGTPGGTPTTKPVGLRSPCKSVLFEDTFRRAQGAVDDEELSGAA